LILGSLTAKTLSRYRPKEMQDRDIGIYSRAKRVKAFRQKLMTQIEEEGWVEKIQAATEKIQKKKKKGALKDRTGANPLQAKKGKKNVEQSTAGKVVKAKKYIPRVEGLNMRPSLKQLGEKKKKKKKAQSGEQGSSGAGDAKPAVQQPQQKQPQPQQPQRQQPQGLTKSRLGSYQTEKKRKAQEAENPRHHTKKHRNVDSK